jgi:hypothetical protein
MDAKMHYLQQKQEEKLERYRDRLKQVEKTVYERVEQEYSHLLQQKDQQVTDQNNRLASMEQDLMELRAALDQERVAR